MVVTYHILISFNIWSAYEKISDKWYMSVILKIFHNDMAPRRCDVTFAHRYIHQNHQHSSHHYRYHHLI